MTQSEKLVCAMQRVNQVLVVMHDNPDPDAIASAWCVVELARHFGQQNIRAVAGGAIVRAENKHLVKLLNPPIELVDDSFGSVGKDVGAILVDCGDASANHLVSRDGIPVIAVIDHHQPALTGAEAEIAFRDVRDVAACASITFSYLIENRIRPSVELATAVWYALRTETCAFESHYSPLDSEVFIWATTFCSPSLLAEIENSPLTRKHLADLSSALSNTVLYRDVAVCWLHDSQGVEAVGEVADLLVRTEGVNRVLCGTEIRGDIYISVRTSPAGGNATSLLLTAIEGLGHGGGHRHRAGGRIKSTARTPGGRSLSEQVIDRWITVNKLDNESPVPLIEKTRPGAVRTLPARSK